MDKNELKEIRKQKFAQMEQQLKETHPKKEDGLFYLGSGDGSLIRCLLAPLMWRNPGTGGRVPVSRIIGVSNNQ